MSHFILLFICYLVVYYCFFFYLQGSFLCGQCHPGFIGDGYLGCHPGDLCTNGSHTCHENAQCTQTGAGRFKCRVWQRKWFNFNCPLLTTLHQRKTTSTSSCCLFLLLRTIFLHVLVCYMHARNKCFCSHAVCFKLLCGERFNSLKFSVLLCLSLTSASVYLDLYDQVRKKVLIL